MKTYYIKDMKNVMEMLFADVGEYNLILGSIGDFVEREIMPSAEKIDQEEIFPRQNLEKVARQGIMAIPFPQDYNGLGLPYPGGCKILWC